MTRLVRTTLHTVMTWSLAVSIQRVHRALTGGQVLQRPQQVALLAAVLLDLPKLAIAGVVRLLDACPEVVDLGVGRPLERLDLGAELVLRHALRFQRPDPLVQGPVELVPARLGAGLESMGALLRPLGPDAGLLGPLLGVGQAPLAARGWRGAWPPRSSRRASWHSHGWCLARAAAATPC